MRISIASLLNQLDSSGPDGLDEIWRERLAYFFVREATKGGFCISSDDATTLKTFIAHCRANVPDSAAFAPVLDHKTGLRVDASIIAMTHRPVGALILHATWIEHWINGVISIAGPQRGLSSDDIAGLLRRADLRSKFGWILHLLGLPPLAQNHLGAILHLCDLRNEYVHYKWTGTAARYGEIDERLRLAVAEAEEHLRYLDEYAIDHLFGPAVTIAERVLKVEYREWIPLFS